MAPDKGGPCDGGVLRGAEKRSPFTGQQKRKVSTRIATKVIFYPPSDQQDRRRLEKEGGRSRANNWGKHCIGREKNASFKTGFRW